MIPVVEKTMDDPEIAATHFSSAAAEAIGNHDDLLSQILLFLETKWLLRYKCVSKHWLSLISSPKFRDRHTLRNPNPPLSSFLFLSTSRRLYSLSLSSSSALSPLQSLPDLRRASLLQSCNGLLLCHDLQDSSYLVLNPTARDLSKIPPPPLSHRSHQCLGSAIAFDPCTTGVAYRVVSVRRMSLSRLGFGMYLSERRRWSLELSVVDFTQEELEAEFDHGGVYCNGAVHWLTHKDEVLYCRIGVDDDGNGLRCGVVASPFSLVFDRVHRYFGESCGRLQLIDISKACVTRFEVRELEADYSGWVVKHSVDLEHLVDTYRPCINEMLSPRDYSGWFVKWKVDLNSASYSFQEVVGYYLDRYYSFVVLAITQEEENGGDPCMLLYFPAKVISYNLRDKSFKILNDLDVNQRSLQVEWLEAYPHRATLACV